MAIRWIAARVRKRTNTMLEAHRLTENDGFWILWADLQISATHVEELAITKQFVFHGTAMLDTHTRELLSKNACLQTTPIHILV